MTEDAIRAVFFKHYSGDDLDEALIATEEEVRLTVLKETGESSESLPDIIVTIFQGQSRVDLFNSFIASGRKNPSVPMSYIRHFDHVRKAMLDVIGYMRDNYEIVQEWFRERFLKEHLKTMSAYISEAIEKPTGMPVNVRGLTKDELNLEEQFFNTALIGIIGLERFSRYAGEYNKCLKVLRQCQREGKIFIDMTDKKES